MNEKELVTALGTNRDESFERFVRVYQDRLYSFALRLSHNKHDAEDIAQEAFVRAYQALRGYKTVWHSGVFRNSKHFLADCLSLQNAVASAAIPDKSISPDGSGCTPITNQLC